MEGAAVKMTSEYIVPALTIIPAFVTATLQSALIRRSLSVIGVKGRFIRREHRSFAETTQYLRDSPSRAQM